MPRSFFFVFLFLSLFFFFFQRISMKAVGHYLVAHQEAFGGNWPTGGVFEHQETDLNHS